MEKLIVIGWDVGGWMGSNNGFSIIEYDYQSHSFEWKGKSVELSIPDHSLFSLDYIIEKTDSLNIDLAEAKIIIAADAPLTYPKAFKELLENQKNDFVKPDKEIYNPLAYRRTDRYIYEKFNKKPLSAVFDRLGTNASAAVVHIRKWMEERNFSLEPVIQNSSSKIIIEVYPALLKESKYAEAFEPIKSMLPKDINKGTDAYDSALCALMGLAYDDKVKIEGLAKLVKAPEHDEEIREEGWIYHFPPEYLKKN